MTDVQEFIESGILEMYVLGQVTDHEAQEVERMAALFNEVQEEITSISITLEQYALRQQETPPDPTGGPFIMAVLAYNARLQNGEVPAAPPPLQPSSVIADYAQWLDRADLQEHDATEDAYAHIIGMNEQGVTAIVWLKHGAPPETHTKELEKFLIVEGSCDITIGDKVHSLVPGNCLSIPLHISHHVRVTSAMPCKIILQRLAA